MSCGLLSTLSLILAICCDQNHSRGTQINRKCVSWRRSQVPSFLSEVLAFLSVAKMYAFDSHQLISVIIGLIRFIFALTACIMQLLSPLSGTCTRFTFWNHGNIVELLHQKCIFASLLLKPESSANDYGSNILTTGLNGMVNTGPIDLAHYVKYHELTPSFIRPSSVTQNNLRIPLLLRTQWSPHTNL